MFVNPASKEYHLARGQMGFDPDPGVKPWTAAQKNAINQAIGHTSDELGLNLTGHFDRIQLDAHGHDWATQGKTNAYLRGTTQAGRSNLSKELSGPASRSVQSWWKEAWDRYGPQSGFPQTTVPGTGAAPTTSPPEKVIPRGARGGLASAIKSARAAVAC